jgi:hypothetical protein
MVQGLPQAADNSGAERQRFKFYTSLQERTVFGGPSRKALILWASWQDVSETVCFEAGLVPALVCGC